MGSQQNCEEDEISLRPSSGHAQPPACQQPHAGSTPVRTNQPAATVACNLRQDGGWDTWETCVALPVSPEWPLCPWCPVLHPSPPPPQAVCDFLGWAVLPLPECHIIGILQCVTFSDFLFHLVFKYPCSTSFPGQRAHFPLALNTLALWGGPTTAFCRSFQPFAATAKAAVSILVLVSA